MSSNYKSSVKKRSHSHAAKDDGSEVPEFKERLAYMQAEFENYKKHVDKEKERFMSRAEEGLVRELLLIVDDLERATEKNKNDEGNKGIEMILSNLLAVLSGRGLKRIDALGKAFDPYYHEAMMSVASDGEEGIVIEELQKGYTFNGSVIRHSKVKVSKK